MAISVRVPANPHERMVDSVGLALPKNFDLELPKIRKSVEGTK